MTQDVRIICLHRIGIEIDGPAIGAMVGEFVRNCWSDGTIPIIDCSYLKRLGQGFTDGFVESMLRSYPGGVTEGALRLAHSSDDIRSRFESAFRTLKEYPAPRRQL